MFAGESGVGKSCYTHYLTHGAAPEGSEMPEATIGMSVKIVTVRPNRQPASVVFTILDVAGFDRFRHTLPAVYRKTEVVVLVYDVTRRETFAALRERWLPEVRAHAPRLCLTLVIGNKADLVRADPALRAVTETEGRVFADEIGAIGFFERSALRDARTDVFWPVDLCAVRLLEMPRTAAAAESHETVKLESSGLDASAPTTNRGCCI
jgi:small GTP-binding protein